MAGIALTSELDRAIREHGREAFPHECCGFLLGKDADCGRRVEEVLPAMNSRGEKELHNRFTITPEAFLQAEKRADATKLDILGFYHSHPNAPARPSQYDLDHAWPVYSYIIVSVQDGKPADMTSWLLKDDRSAFEPENIVIND